jgi:hypothetical protein
MGVSMPTTLVLLLAARPWVWLCGTNRGALFPTMKKQISELD